MREMTYLLQVILDRDTSVRVGSLGNMDFKKGTYFYIGSARKGLRARVKRHLSGEKRLFWHIDYLLSSKGASIKTIWINWVKILAINCELIKEKKNAK